jgi:hypothetical protein
MDEESRKDRNGQAGMENTLLENKSRQEPSEGQNSTEGEGVEE